MTAVRITVPMPVAIRVSTSVMPRQRLLVDVIVKSILRDVGIHGARALKVPRLPIDRHGHQLKIVAISFCESAWAEGHRSDISRAQCILSSLGIKIVCEALRDKTGGIDLWPRIEADDLHFFLQNLCGTEILAPGLHHREPLEHSQTQGD